MSAGPLWCPLSLITDPGEANCLLSPRWPCTPVCCPARLSVCPPTGRAIAQHNHDEHTHTQTPSKIMLHNISQFNSGSVVFIVGGLYFCTQICNVLEICTWKNASLKHFMYKNHAVDEIYMTNTACKLNKLLWRSRYYPHM